MSRDVRHWCVRRRRVVLTPRRWRQVLERLTLLGGDGGKKARSPGRARISRQTTAQGRPECFRFTCMLVCAFLVHQCTRDRGCSVHPAFSAPLCGSNLSECANGRLYGQPPVAGTEPVAPRSDRACKRARDSSGVFLNPNSCKGFEPEPSKEGSGRWHKMIWLSWVSMSPRTRWMCAFARCLNGRRSQTPQAATASWWLGFASTR